MCGTGVGPHAGTQLGGVGHFWPNPMNPHVELLFGTLARGSVPDVIAYASVHHDVNIEWTPADAEAVYAQVALEFDADEDIVAVARCLRDDVRVPLNMGAFIRDIQWDDSFVDLYKFCGLQCV